MSTKTRIEKLEARAAPPENNQQKWEHYWRDLNKAYGRPGQPPEPVPADPEQAINDTLDKVYGTQQGAGKAQD